MSETALTIERTPEIIATEIISIREQGKKIVLMASIEIGKRLVEAKELVPHGEWGKFLEEKVDYSPRTANNFMQLYKEYGGSQMNLFGGTADSQAIADLSYTQAVALLGIPSHERDEFIKENDVENMSVRELQQAIKERDEAQRKLKEVEEVADQIVAERDMFREEVSGLRDKVRVTDQVLKSTKADVKMLQESLEKERQRKKDEVEKLSKLLEEAKKGGAPNEQVEQLKAELTEAQGKVKALEEEAAKPVTLEPAVVEVEKIPEDVERELAELRAKAKQAGQPEVLLRFKVRFDAVVGGFDTLLTTLEEIKTVEPDTYEKYHRVVVGLLDRMQESLQ